jgi:hypothetical protein
MAMVCDESLVEWRPIASSKDEGIRGRHEAANLNCRRDPFAAIDAEAVPPW